MARPVATPGAENRHSEEFRERDTVLKKVLTIFIVAPHRARFGAAAHLCFLEAYRVACPCASPIWVVLRPRETIVTDELHALDAARLGATRAGSRR